MIKTSYKIDGRSGEWVTLVTGIANDLTMWDGQVPALEKDFRVLRYDLRGQGGSEATPGPYSIALLLQDLVDLLDSLNIEKTHLVGLGLGGCIVQAAAIERPERVAKLMPCCCRAQMVPDFAVMWRGLVDNVKKNGFESIVEPTVQRWFSEEFKAAHPAVLENIRKMIRRTSLDGYLGCIAAFLGVSLEEKLPLIRARTHYVSGADDKLGGPPELMSRFAAKVPGARHSSVPNAAHIANIQNPGGFNLVLGEFLRSR